MEPVSVTALPLRRDFMTKATLINRKRLIGAGLLIVSEGQPMAIMEGSMVAGRPVWCWSSSWAYICRQEEDRELGRKEGMEGREREERETGSGLSFWKVTAPPARPHLLILPKQSARPAGNKTFKSMNLWGWLNWSHHRVCMKNEDLQAWQAPLLLCLSFQFIAESPNGCWL